ncbi:MAG: cobalamin-independent methionine synthase II family protein [Alphaproteobacteria bacterium]|jgi:5-methyltetrahydropteroyltriglutamate--homocysteine methyltransferase|nr:cobalamin-independent methionine synthase II family protein [Alphaproteobacteria bacterium]MDP6238239.1 cobalamin-independent methionine synthase II family protein [Alphaproteobacteria bacterium]MDP7174200.1 cobalamin-independent methionine synthase II family protein [Alphaproteobacteria bacterium]MDP7233005.1 cobalamin-independent methionine synthase II family protein [Alphaproteobacteria bacterium]MDP7488244.1 cobalamin-independent methionine synthase II family protein [Alphaproteobacteria|tara:strand:- start:2681 stop:3823 length:1143 start_codon:yes stop_codon:yes gene_type:complete
MSDRILTTHVGSLPRPNDMLALLDARDRGELLDDAAFAETAARAVADVVARQAALGIDILSDGEMAKTSYATYLTDRLSGFGGRAEKGPAARDLLDYLAYAKRLVEAGGTEKTLAGAACNAPLALKDPQPLKRDITNFAAARTPHPRADGFLSACSPGVVTIFLQNQYYPSHEAYLDALVPLLKDEYETIAASGVVLQIDCPDLGMGRHLVHADKSTEDFCKVAARHIEALNAATADIAPERMRLHICWGNYEGPHHHDIPLSDIIDLVYAARPAGISIEGANPRHEHEWEIFADKPLPDGKVIVPGVIDSTTNYIEHPRLVAQRIERFASLVGRERVIASTDCGFATFAHHPSVDPEIAWAKLGALVEGASLATEALWK